MLQTLYYENDKYLNKIRIDKTIEALKQYPPDAAIIVTGHTDKEGSEQHNWELSELRAKAIGEYVQRQLPDRKVSYKGYGYSRPIELVSPSPINRRVEISVID
ncbi:MAG: OmpA family protein [Bacteroidetes bacterium]|nr:OmpA family protein [Bacteroidota bacterium]